jgi:transposase
VSGAETPDVSLLAETLAARIIRRATAYAFAPQYLSGDKGYTGETAWKAAQEAGYTPALQQRGATTDRVPFPAARLRRWTVERCHRWLNLFRKLTIRYEKLKRSYAGLLQLACAMICWRQTILI